jgi:hypothetical protein
LLDSDNELAAVCIEWAENNRQIEKNAGKKPVQTVALCLSN